MQTHHLLHRLHLVVRQYLTAHDCTDRAHPLNDYLYLLAGAKGQFKTTITIKIRHTTS